MVEFLGYSVAQRERWANWRVGQRAELVGEESVLSAREVAATSFVGAWKFALRQLELSSRIWHRLPEQSDPDHPGSDVLGLFGFPLPDFGNPSAGVEGRKSVWD